MSNTKLKEGLGAIARGVALLPGVTLSDAASVEHKTRAISAKIDQTNGLDTTVWPHEMELLNPKAGAVVPATDNSAGVVAVLAAVPLLAELDSGAGDWLNSIGVANHERNLDGEQSDHAAALDELHNQSCGCADSVQNIDDAANLGMQQTIDVLLDLIAALEHCPLVELGSLVLGPIMEGLLCIEGTVEDRNESIGNCYDNLEQLCDDAGSTVSPPLKQYTPSGVSAGTSQECPPVPAPAPPAPVAAAPEPQTPKAETCPTTPAQAPPAPVETPEPTSPEPQIQPQPVAECPPVAEREPDLKPEAKPDTTPESKPESELSPAPETEQTPHTPETPETPVQTTAPVAAATGAEVKLDITIDANIDYGLPVAEVPDTQTIPAHVNPEQTVHGQCPNPALPVPPSVPPVGPGGDCLVKHVIAGLEAFGRVVAECLAQFEIPAEPAADLPEPELEPEVEPDVKPVSDCPDPEPEPEPEQPVTQPECDEETIAPPPELAEVKEPPPPPKKGLVEPAAVGGAEPDPQPEPEAAAEGTAEESMKDAAPQDTGDEHRARKTGGW